MARMMYYIITAIVLTMMLNLFSMDTQNDEGILDIVGLAGFKEDNTNLDYGAADFFTRLFGSAAGILIVAGALGGIALTFFSKSPQENFLILPFVTIVLVVFVGALWNTIIASSSYDNWIRIPIIVFMGPFTVGYILTMVEFFRGNV